MACSTKAVWPALRLKLRSPLLLLPSQYPLQAFPPQSPPELTFRKWPLNQARLSARSSMSYRNVSSRCSMTKQRPSRSPRHNSRGLRSAPVRRSVARPCCADDVCATTSSRLVLTRGAGHEIEQEWTQLLATGLILIRELTMQSRLESTPISTFFSLSTDSQIPCFMGISSTYYAKRIKQRCIAIGTKTHG